MVSMQGFYTYDMITFVFRNLCGSNMENGWKAGCGDKLGDHRRNPGESMGMERRGHS